MIRLFRRAALPLGVLALLLGASPCWAQNAPDGYYAAGDGYSPGGVYVMPDYGVIYSPAMANYVYTPAYSAYSPGGYYAPTSPYGGYAYGPFAYGRSAYNRMDSGYYGPGYGLPPVAYGIAPPAYNLASPAYGIAPAAYGPTTYGIYGRGYRR